METTVSFSEEQLAAVPKVRKALEGIDTAPEDREPTILARDDGYDPSTLTGILGEQGLSRQLGLLPEQAVLKFKGTVPIHGDAEFKLGQRFTCTVECVVSADATKGKVEDGELVEPGKTQEATVLNAARTKESQ